jgi:hypothetical protein
VVDTARIEELRRRLRKDPASIAFAQLAEELRRTGACEEAVGVCRAGLVQHPGYLSARVTLGRALIDLGRLDEAAAEIVRVLETAPDNLAAERAWHDLHLRGFGQPRGSITGAVAAIGDGGPLVTAVDSVPAPVAERAEGDAAVLLQLESWLSAIRADRERRCAAR